MHAALGRLLSEVSADRELAEAGIRVALQEVEEPGDPATLDDLAESERAMLADLRIAKRRREWLAGRRAAKEAVRALLAQVAPGPERIAIARAATGAPEVWLDRRPEPRIGVSVSHAGELAAACAYERSDRPGPGVGIDLEAFAPVDHGMLESAFSASERRWIAGGEGRVHQAWTAKEAVAKALGVGLSVDLRALLLTPGERDGECKIEVAALSAAGNPARFRARTFCAEGYVLTVAKVAAPFGLRPASIRTGGGA